MSTKSGIEDSSPTDPRKMSEGERGVRGLMPIKPSNWQTGKRVPVAGT